MSTTPQKNQGVSPFEFLLLCKNNAAIIAGSIASISLVALALTQISIALNQFRAEVRAEELKLTCAQWKGSNIGTQENKRSYARLVELTMDKTGESKNRGKFLEFLCQ